MNLFSLGYPSWLWEAINGIWLMLCALLYSAISWLYQVFEKVAGVNLFSREIFEKITGRIYVIMGIAMLFIFAYNLILMIINPEDKKSTGTTAKIVKETIISLIIVVLLPVIFNYMYIVQSHVLESNIIGQIIMGSVGNTSGDTTNCDPDDYDCTCDFSAFTGLSQYSDHHNFLGFRWNMNSWENETDQLRVLCEKYNSNNVSDSQRGAYTIGPLIFSAFYRPNLASMEDCERILRGDVTPPTDESYETFFTDIANSSVCANYFFAFNAAKYSGDMWYLISDEYLNAKISDPNDSSMKFDWFFAIVAGGLGVWMFLCYAMEIGVRVAKLGLLQLISPIAVMMRIVPGQKEKIYDKWFKNIKETYLDVFIRLFIIYFAFFAIGLIPDVFDTLWKSNWSGDGNLIIKLLSMVIVILGILKFAQEAPNLIKEFFGDSGKFTLKSPTKQFNENKLAKGAIGGGGTMLNRFVNKAGNYARIAKNKDLSKGQKVWQGLKNTGSMLNPLGYGKAAKQGFDATKDGKILEGINTATAKNLTDKGFLYKARTIGGDALDQLKHYATTDYMGLNADGLKRENAVINNFLSSAKNAFDRVENDKRIGAVNDFYTKRKEEEQKKGNFNAVQALEDERKNSVKMLRKAIAEEKSTGKVVEMKQNGDKIEISNGKADSSKIDIAFKTAMNDLQANLKENFTSIEKVLKDTNATFKDFSDKKMPNTLSALSKDIGEGNMTLVDDMTKKLGQRLDSNNVELSKIKELAEGKKDKK